MAESILKEYLNTIFAALSHPARRRIIELLFKYESLSFTDLLRESGLKDKSTLNYHLEKLKGLVDKTGGIYRLTLLGRVAKDVVEYTTDLLEEALPAIMAKKIILVLVSSRRLIKRILIVSTCLACIIATYFWATSMQIYSIFSFLVILSLAGAVCSLISRKYIIGPDFIIIETLFKKTVYRGDVVYLKRTQSKLQELAGVYTLVFKISSFGEEFEVKVSNVEYSDKLERELKMISSIKLR